MMTSRDGHEIGITYEYRDEKGNAIVCREMQEHEMAFLESIRNFLPVLKANALRVGMHAKLLLLVAQTKLGANLLPIGYAGLKVDYLRLPRTRGNVKITYDGKKIVLEGFSFYEDTDLLPQIFIKNQYDVNKSNMGGKIVADIGAHVGTFAILCALHGCKKVYAFEPSPKLFAQLKRNIELNGLGGKIIPINKAVGENEGFIPVVDDGKMVCIGKNTEGADAKNVEMTSLDSFFGNGKERVDFIKMDIEGYEENALKGAKEVIRMHKPVLSFSAYHKPTDKTILPRTVLEIRPDYRIKLNFYSEEDFYCD